MLRNVSRSLLVLGAALLAFAPGLSAQTGGTPVRGDVDGDGRVTPADAAIVTNYLVGRTVPAGVDINRADVNGDGRVTAADAAIITAFAAGRDVKRFPVGRPDPIVPKGLASVACSADVRARTVTCGAPTQLPGGARGLVVGGQHTLVDLTSFNRVVTPVAGDTADFSFDVKIKNLMTQTLGTADGVSLDPAGVKIFFATAPVVTAGSGQVEVRNAQMGTVTATNQLYYEYDQMLPTGAISAAKNWVFRVDTIKTQHFDFLLLVSARVPHEEGSVVILAPNTLETGDTVTSADSVLYANGTEDTHSVVRWSSSDTTLAQIDSVTGEVLGVGEGTVTITGTAPPGTNSGRPDTARANHSLLVRSPAPYSKITASPDTVPAGNTTTITVQLKNSAGNNIHHPAGPVVLSTTAGAILSAVTNHLDGTYTATLTSTTAGTYPVSGTLRGVAIGDTALATFAAAAPAHVIGTSLTPQNGAVGVAVGTPPAVHVTDQYGNSVPGATVNFSVTGGGGSVSGGPAVTGPGGNAAVGGWTLGGSGLNTLQATVTGTPDTARFTAYVPPVAGVDSSQAIGNFQLPNGVAGNVLSNDASQNGGTVTLPITGNLTTDRGGTVNLSSNGTFTYLPPAGITGRDSVQYTIQDGLFTGTAPKGWLKFRFVSKVWFVDNSSGASPDGRDTNPFTSISAAEAVAGTGETILVRTGSGTTAGGTLKDGQTVNGQNLTTAVTMPLNVINGPTVVTLLPTGSSPTIGALALGNGNTLQNFTSAGGITGSTFGTLTVSQVGINNPSGQALSLTNGTLSGGFTSLISGGGTNNVLLSGVSTPSTQTLGASGNTLSGATSDAVVVTGGSGSFTFPGDVSNATSFAVNVNAKTGGTVTFSGTINPGAAGRGISVTGNNSGTNTIVFSGANQNISSGAAAGVVLTNNTGATISFTGGNLAVTTTSGIGFSATGGGTVQVTGAGNSVTSGAAPQAVNLNGITIGSSGMAFNTISGTATTGSAFRAVSVGNSGGGAFTAASLTVAGTAGASSRGIELTTNSAPFTFTTVSVNGTGGEGIYLTSNTAAVAVNGGTVGNTSNTTGDAFFVSGGNAGITMAASLTKSSAGRAANIGSHTAGSVTLSGALSCTGSCTGINVNGNSGGTIDFTNGTKTLTTGASAAVTVSSNTGATINFTNGGLAITTSSGAGYNATGGGTVTVTGSNNTIASGTGTALNVSSTTIGSNGLTFRTVTAAGAPNGIVLSSTGTSGGLTVTGDGSTNGSGGSITNSSGADGATAGNGVYLSSTKNVSLSWMSFSGNQNNGVYGTGVNGFTMNKTRFTGTANGTSDNTSGNYNESDVQLVSVSGPVKLTNSRFDGAAYNAVRIENINGTAPTVDSLVIDTDTVSTMQGSTASVRGTALLVSLMDGTSDTRIRNNRVTAWWGNGIHVLVQGTASGTSRITNNFVDNTNGAVAGAGGIWVTGGNHAYNISGNTVRHTNGSAISADRVNFGSNMNGTIDSNTIGVSGDNNSGTATGAAIFVSHHGPGTTTAKVSSNTIRQAQAASGTGAIWLLTGDAAGFGGSGTFNATVVSNDIQESGTPTINAHNGILATVGTQSGPPTDTDQVCLDIGGSTAALKNNIANFNSNTNRIRVNQRFGTTSRFPGYTGAQLSTTSQTDLASYLVARNGAAVTSVNANTSTGGFNNTSPAGSACAQPSM